MTRVLHEDASVLAVDKPAGVLVVRGRMGEAEPSLLDQLARERREALRLVHRLDRGTSGVLLLARSPAAQREMSLAFERGRVHKRYLALVRGEPPVPELTVDVALVAARRGKSRPAAKGEEGKPSVTTFRLVERFHGFALLEALPQTGRTHQIRVHLRYAGYPLAVDGAYAGVERILRGELGLAPAGDVLLGRTPLHAQRLTLPHPDTGEPLTVEAPLPADLEVALGLLRGLR
ncbi:MAG: RluA family pseudouridine synthase [Deltaproteobacteria bacterium]|nr:RluA family pseudouridine synthase [Deltaproteobacteria bacterium]